MALIKCPECGGQVSDKADVCIHCGYPIKNIDNTLIREETNKEIVLTDKEKVIALAKDGLKVQAIKEIQSQTNLNLHEARKLLENMNITKVSTILPKKVMKKAPKIIKCPVCDNNIYENVEKCFYCGTEFREYSKSHKQTEIVDNEIKRQILFQEHDRLREQEILSKTNDTTVRCPKCGSTQIQMVSRKWSLLTGFLTNKVDRVCMNCKHKF